MAKKRRKANPEKVKTQKRKYYIKKRNDPIFKLNRVMSGGIHKALRGGKNGCHWENSVDFTLDNLIKHLEKQFTKGMTWNKFLIGEIHIDHIVPRKVFNFTKPEHTDFKKCWALKNLQPMWALDNLKKGANLEKHFQPSLAI